MRGIGSVLMHGVHGLTRSVNEGDALGASGEKSYRVVRRCVPYILYSSNLNPRCHADTLAKRLVKRGLVPGGTNASIATEPWKGRVASCSESGSKSATI